MILDITRSLNYVGITKQKVRLHEVGKLTNRWSPSVCHQREVLEQSPVPWLVLISHLRRCCEIRLPYRTGYVVMHGQSTYKGGSVDGLPTFLPQTFYFFLPKGEVSVFADGLSRVALHRLLTGLLPPLAQSK